MSFPRQIKLELARRPQTGLLVVTSHELPALLVGGYSIEEIERRVPASVAAIIQAQYGVEVKVALEAIEEDESEAVSLSRAHVEEAVAA